MSVLPGRITVKHVLKRGAGVASTWLRPFVAPTSLTRACILMYHRVAPVPFVDPHLDNWNVTPAGFERQIAALAESAELVALGDLPALFAAPPRGRGSKPLVCLTFDDGFANFHSHALPILRRYHAPATLFVVTAFVGSPDPMPFDRWSKRYCRDLPPAFWRPIAWQDLDDCVATGLVTIGSHSHRHRRGIDCAPGELREEAEESRAILRRRLGDAHAVHPGPKIAAVETKPVQRGPQRPGQVEQARRARIAQAQNRAAEIAEAPGRIARDPHAWRHA